MQQPNSQNLRHTLGQFATGVTVLSCLAEGQACGMTANSFCSISLEPPLIQVAVNQQAKFNHWLKQAPFYAINVLAEDQQTLAMHFAKQLSEPIEPPWLNHNFEYQSTQHSLPLIDGCLASIICTTEKISQAGTHDLYLSQIQQLTHCSKRPLLFFDGRYTKFLS